MEMTDNQYLEMANHAKELIDNKEKIISFLKSKLYDLDSDLRNIEYRVKQMEHIINYQNSISKNKEIKNLIAFLEKDLKYILKVSDSARINCQEEIDEELILILDSVEIDSEDSE